MALSVNPQNWNDMMKKLTEFLLSRNMMKEGQRGDLNLLKERQRGSMDIVNAQSKSYQDSENLRHQNDMKQLSQKLADAITLEPTGQRLQIQAHMAKSKGEDPSPFIEQLRSMVTNKISGAQGLLGGMRAEDLSPEQQTALGYLEEGTLKALLGDLGAQKRIEKQAEKITVPSLASQDRRTAVAETAGQIEGYKATTDRMKLNEAIKAGPGAGKGAPKPSDWNSLYDRLMSDEKAIVTMMSDLDLANIGAEMSPEDKQEQESLTENLANIQVQKTEVMNSYRSAMGLAPVAGAPATPAAGDSPEQTLQQTVEILMSKYNWPYEKAYRRAYAAIYGKEPGTDVNR